MQLPDNAKTKRFINQLQKPARDKRIEQELPEIPGAIERFEKLEKQVSKQKEQIADLMKRVNDLVAEKFQRDMRGDNAETKQL